MIKLFEWMIESENESSCFHYFQSNISHIPLPIAFDYPHQFSPHPLAILAVDQFKSTYLNCNYFKSDFGMDNEDSTDSGKMFGVLLVKNIQGEIGFLTSFSGNIGDQKQYERIVPSIFDTLNPNGFYKKGEDKLNLLTIEIESFENDPLFLQNKILLLLEKEHFTKQLASIKSEIALKKTIRDEKRSRLNPTSDKILLNELSEESKKENMQEKKFRKAHISSIQNLESNIKIHEAQVLTLKKTRAKNSERLQIELFKAYELINDRGEKKSIYQIHQEFNKALPPAGTGECALPKMLHYAFMHDLTPLTFAEFWWGKSKENETRMHGQFYPACRSKCEALLVFLLQTIPTHSHPMHLFESKDMKLEIVYEDDYLFAINKPPNTLSVPGKTTKDSIQSNLMIRFPNHPELKLIHRLDMGTSGILLVAKSLIIYKKMQALFAERKVLKTYTALLDGIPKIQHGEINLPLRVDLDNRPYQIVCFEHGKAAQTNFKIIETLDKHTRIQFYPVTGRTHQLRVHSAHHLGLHCPILGDELYGIAKDRLYLHASRIVFEHPITKTSVDIKLEANF